MDVLLIALAVSIDGLLAGLAIGLRGLKLRGYSYMIVLVVTFICVFLTMVCVQWLFASVAPTLAQWLGSLAILTVATLTFMRSGDESDNCARDCSVLESVMLGIGVAADASIASASLALLGHNVVIVALLMALMHAVLIGFGNILGRKGIHLRGRAMQIIPALMLAVIGIMRMPIFS